MTDIIWKINLKITLKKDILKNISIKKKQYIKKLIVRVQWLNSSNLWPGAWTQPSSIMFSP
jgi:hypothetical protein